MALNTCGPCPPNTGYQDIPRSMCPIERKIYSNTYTFIMPKQAKKKATVKKVKVNREAGIHLHKSKPRKGGKPQYFWILISRNGRTLATSEMYVFKQGATKAIKTVFNFMEGIYKLKPVNKNNGYYFDHTEKGYEAAANLVAL